MYYQYLVQVHDYLPFLEALKNNNQLSSHPWITMEFEY